ncbi:AbrB/MazE/SpoVT family DNA-binding domain-containing protein [Lysinibacillus sphaericus]|uniref:AbrB/MazE/SpoVT family DNA-binding domain-containing protein n=1 Tax=Lysinibacillus sphaericus TaxID=1421 RepID=UPI003F7A4353
MLLKKAKISSKYQISIPSYVRTQLGLDALDYVSFVENTDGRIYLEKAIENIGTFKENGFDFIALAQTLLSKSAPLILIGDVTETKHLFKELLLDSLSVQIKQQVEVAYSPFNNLKDNSINELLNDESRYTIVITDHSNQYEEISKKYDCTLICFKNENVQTVLKLEHSNPARVIYNSEN